MESYRSRWAREALAIWRKDVMLEWRSRHGVSLALLFAVMTVFTLGLSTSTAVVTRTLSSDAQAGLLWVALLFSGMVALGRGFISEEEQGTGDTLRLAAAPQAVYWGKLAFHLSLFALLSAAVVPLYVLMIGVTPQSWGLFLLVLLMGGLGLTLAITTCGALVSRSSSRGSMLSILAFPVLVPLVLLAVNGTKAALVGGAQLPWAWSAVGGLICYSIVIGGVSPLVFRLIWEE